MNIDVPSIIEACRLLPFEGKVSVRVALTEMMSADLKSKWQERSCDHPKHRIHERRRGDRSMDLVCGRCGATVDFID